MIAGEEVMEIILYIIGGPMFLMSIVAHLYVKLRLQPKDDSDLDDYYHEFEHLHPGLARYTQWSQITFIAAIIGALLVFVAMVI